MTQAVHANLVNCHVCGKLSRATGIDAPCCPRCGSALEFRKPASIARTWALLVAAVLLYLPANLLPVMRTTYVGEETADTIISGVVYFLLNGDWPLAVIIFTASVVVPLLKMLALGFLLVTVQRHHRYWRRGRTTLYRITELMGRWSMVDVFVIALLTALVQAGYFAQVVPDLGAVAFCAVVILTMLAAETFDPRLIWDEAGTT